jgi:cellulose biosynthesis protein BcsQ
LSRTFEALRSAEAVRRQDGRQRDEDGRRRSERPFRVVTVTSNKGGVGKTTIATNLAVYLRALSEDLPILVVGLDDQPMIDRMFETAGEAGGPTIADALRRRSLDGAIRLGQYGVHYVPTSRDVTAAKREIDDPACVESMLARTDWRGLVIVDTKSDFEILTRSAIAAADLTLAVVKDHASLLEAERVFELFRGWRRPYARARVVLSLVDLRIRFKDGAVTDMLSLLLEEIRRRGYPLFESFLSRSPKVESLYTNPSGRALSILHAAQGTPVHKQMHDLAADVLDALVVPSVTGAEAPLGVPDEGEEGGLDEMKRWLLFGPAGNRAGGPSGAGD